MYQHNHVSYGGVGLDDRLGERHKLSVIQDIIKGIGFHTLYC